MDTNHLANYTYYPIDVSDIWLYERNVYLDMDAPGKKKSWSHYEALYQYLQVFYLQLRVPPFISVKEVKQNRDHQGYYDKLLAEVNGRKEEGTLLDFYVCRGSIYNMEEPCVVERSNTTELDFQRLFAFKLSQYSGGLVHLRGMFLFHLEHNFLGDTSSFKHFLSTLLDQFAYVLGEKVIRWMHRFIDTELHNGAVSFQQAHDQIAEANEGTTKGEAPMGNIEAAAAKDIGESEETKETVPEGYRQVPGKYSLREVQQFFSFLYLEKGPSGQSFLTKEAVESIFRYGIALPPEPLQNPYRLNHSRRFPLAIVHYMVYKFFFSYSYSNGDKMNILKFLGAYFHSYRKALESDKAAYNLSKDIKDKRPKSMQFDPEKYLPQRML